MRTKVQRTIYRKWTRSRRKPSGGATAWCTWAGQGWLFAVLSEFHTPFKGDALYAPSASSAFKDNWRGEGGGDLDIYSIPESIKKRLHTLYGQKFGHLTHTCWVNITFQIYSFPFNATSILQENLLSRCCSVALEICVYSVRSGADV